MIFRKFGKILPNVSTLDGVIRYLSNELALLIEQLNANLNRLRLVDNFAGYRAKVSANLVTGTLIRHNLNSKIDHFVCLNGISGIKLFYVDNNSVTVALDGDVYGGGIIKDIDIILYR